MAKTTLKTISRKTSVSRKKVRQVIAEISKVKATTKLPGKSLTSNALHLISKKREATNSK